MMQIEEKFLKAHDEYAASILRHISFRVSDEMLAQDLTQETFFKAWKYVQQSGGQLKEINNIKAFLYKVANNLIIDHYRGKKRFFLSHNSFNEDELVFEPKQKKEAEISIEMEIVERALMGMDEEYRQIILYRYIDELSVKEIANITKKTANNISVIIHRALKQLKEKINV